MHADVATVASSAQSLPEGGSILDLACGSGVPIAEALLRAGYAVHGVDAAQSMVAAVRARLPTATTSISIQ